jgi:hypothetical protein
MDVGVQRFLKPGEAAARWAEDPSGRHQYRYWDGSTWTEHTADNGVSSTDSLSDSERAATSAPVSSVGGVKHPVVPPTKVASADRAPAESQFTPGPLSPPAVPPIRNNADILVTVGQKRRKGRLLLYPDRLVHVDSKLPQFLTLIPLLSIRWASRGVARVLAARKVAAGDTSVLAVPLTVVSEVRTQKAGLGKVLIILTATGAEHHFLAVNCDKWLADLSKALTDSGSQVSPSEVGFPVK